MKTIWLFDDLEYIPDERRLVRTDGECKLQPRAATLLTALLEHATEIVPYDELIRRIWPDSITADPGDLRKVKNQLNNDLGRTDLIKTASGYGLTVPAQLKAATSSSEFPTVMTVYPGSAGTYARSYNHSVISWGGKDKVKAETPSSGNVSHGKALVDPRHPSTLMIPFTHAGEDDSETNSWWSLVIPLKVNPKPGTWLPVDLARFQLIEVEARAVGQGTTHPLVGPVLLRVRLEDSSTSGTAGSRRHSTNWYPEPTLLTAHFQKFDLHLDGFDWSSDAWVWNAGPVKRTEMVQVVFGQDGSTPRSSGIVELRNIRLLSLGAPKR